MQVTKMTLNVMKAPVWERKATMVSGSAQTDATTGVDDRESRQRQHRHCVGKRVRHVADRMDLELRRHAVEADKGQQGSGMCAPHPPDPARQDECRCRIGDRRDDVQRVT